MSPEAEDSLRSLSLDYLNLLINGQDFTDVTFCVEGRLLHAHRCVLAARSPFFRKFFCGPDSDRAHGYIPVNCVGYEAFLLVLQFLYSGQVSIVPPKPDCGDRASCDHAHCSSAIDLALHTLSAARSFGVEQLAFITQKQLAGMVERASIEDVMKILVASRKHEMHQLWSISSRLVAKSGIPTEALAKHLPIDVIAAVEDLRLVSSAVARCCLNVPRHHREIDAAEDPRIRRMRRALNSSDVELVKLMVMGEGLNLDDALALHYAVENCSREVVKALLELGAADVNHVAEPTGKTPLHIAAEMVSPDMVAVLLDHHADPNVRTAGGVTPLEILRTLTSDFLLRGAVPGSIRIEPNKLRLCLELVQSAAMVISREEENANATSSGAVYPAPIGDHDHGSSATTTLASATTLRLDSRMSYPNLGAEIGGKLSEGEEIGRHGRDSSSRHACSMYHHPHHSHDHHQY